MNIRKLVFAGCGLVAGGVGFGAFVLLNLGSHPATPISPLSLTGARSFNLPNDVIVSCDANGNNQAVSFISQNVKDGSKTTVIISEHDKQTTVAFINVNADRYLYSHWPDPIGYTQATHIKGTYDAGRNLYKTKSPDPSEPTPIVSDWQKNLSLTHTICGGHAPDGMTVTIRNQGLGAYSGNTLDNVDHTLNGFLPWKEPVTRSQAEKYLNLKNYGISVFLPS